MKNSFRTLGLAHIQIKFEQTRTHTNFICFIEHDLDDILMYTFGENHLKACQVFCMLNEQILFNKDKNQCYECGFGMVFV